MTWKEFVKLEHNVLLSIFKRIETAEDEEEKDILIIGTRIIVDIINIIRTKNSDYTKYEFINKELESNSALLNKQGFTNIINYNTEFKRRSILKKLLIFIKILININISRLTNIFKPIGFVAIESLNMEYIRYVNEYGLLIPVFVSSYFDSNSEKNVNNEKIKLISSRLCITITKTISDDTPNIIVPEKDLHDIVSDYFNDIYCDYCRLKNRRLLPNIIVGTHNKTFIRLYSRLINKRGNTVISFAHGHTLQNKDDHKFWMDLILSNYYYEYNKVLSVELNNYISNHKYKKLINTNINYCKQDLHYNEKYKKTSFDINSIKSVLVIGNATKNIGHSSVTAYDIKTQIDIELSIMKYFNSLGKKVYYKPHPSGHLKKEILDLYAEYNFINLENKTFEDIEEKYDLISFYYTRTSTIKSALKGNNHIMLFDLEIEEFTENSNNTLSERCIIKKFSDIN
jgi:hypothetical protein